MGGKESERQCDCRREQGWPWQGCNRARGLGVAEAAGQGRQAGSSSAGRLASPDGLPRQKQVKEATGVSQPRKWAQQEQGVGEGKG